MMKRLSQNETKNQGNAAGGGLGGPGTTTTPYASGKDVLKNISSSVAAHAMQ